MAQPPPGAPDLELDRVKSVFRFCPHCRRYVGRECCWVPESVACRACADALVTAPPDDVGPARRGLAELELSVRGLESIGIDLDRAIGSDGSLAAWEEAWWGASWLLTRAESSRDAVSRRLWHGRGLGDQARLISAELSTLLVEYSAARWETEEVLAACGHRIAAE